MKLFLIFLLSIVVLFGAILVFLSLTRLPLSLRRMRGVFLLRKDRILQVKPVKSEKDLAGKPEGLPEEVRNKILAPNTDIRQVKSRPCWRPFFSLEDNPPVWEGVKYLDFKNFLSPSYPPGKWEKEEAFFSFKAALRALKEKKKKGEAEEIKLCQERDKKIKEFRTKFLEEYSKK